MANQIDRCPPCVVAHFALDTAITWPLQQAGKQVFTLITSRKGTGFFDTITPRLLCLAQSIISLVILPFKMIFAIFSGIDTIFNPTDLRALANVGYALVSVAIHAVLVPAGVILAFLPVSAIEEVAKMRGILDEQAEALIRNMNVGPMRPNRPPGAREFLEPRRRERREREVMENEIVDQLEGREGERRPAFAGPDAQPPPGAADPAQPPPYNARVGDLRPPPSALNAGAPGYGRFRLLPTWGAFRFW
jgi:hypothetical protein